MKLYFLFYLLIVTILITPDAYAKGHKESGNLGKVHATDNFNFYEMSGWSI